jgi:hypothetical protein
MIETIPEISVRDRALAVYRAQQEEAEAHAEEQRRYAFRQDMQLFSIRLKQCLGIDASPTEATFELGEDGTTVLYQGGKLYYVVPCHQCGGATRSWPVWDWVSLGCAIDAYEGERLSETCPECLAIHHATEEQSAAEAQALTPTKPTLEEKFMDLLRAVVRHEIYRAVENP